MKTSVTLEPSTTQVEPTKHPRDRESCDDWYERYDAYQRSLGRYGTRSQWRTWISPRIGTKPMVDVTSSDIERIRDALDDAILSWRRHGGGRLAGQACISGRTAMQVWWAVTGAFQAATSTKRSDLRMLAGRANPCTNVEPPGDRESRRGRRKPFIYPCEFDQLARCLLVPREWRELHAFAAYTYLRPGELRALRWSAVDLENGIIQVSFAWDYALDEEKAPKSWSGIREVPLPPALAPMLHRMRARRDVTSRDLVLPVILSRSPDTLAWRLRRHLWSAGIRRPELHQSTLTRVRAGFRSWRDSGITWSAMLGVGLAQIMRRAGHADVTTSCATSSSPRISAERWARRSGNCRVSW